MKLSRKVPLNALRVFEAVARHRGFSRAADELGMTQTAVSYQIKLLEEHIGEQLFLRQPRQIVNTETAERMLPDVSKALELLNDAMVSARQASNETLEIHSSPTFASHWLARNLGSFQLDYPAIAVRLLRVSKITDFNRDPADISIRWGVGPWPEHECHLLGRFSFAPMLSPGLADSIGGISSPMDLLKLPIIGAGQSSWQTWVATVDVPTPDLSAHTRHNYVEQDLCANAALAGQGRCHTQSHLLFRRPRLRPVDCTLQPILHRRHRRVACASQKPPQHAENKGVSRMDHSGGFSRHATHRAETAQNLNPASRGGSGQNLEHVRSYQNIRLIQCKGTKRRALLEPPPDAPVGQLGYHRIKPATVENRIPHGENRHPAGPGDAAEFCKARRWRMAFGEHAGGEERREMIVVPRQHFAQRGALKVGVSAARTGQPQHLG